MTATAGVMIDTNILIYAADPTDPAKQARALTLIDGLRRAGSLTISVQVLNEFYAVATRPRKPPSLSHDAAHAVVADLATTATVLPLTAAATLRALDAMPRHGLSFWDALIWAVAREHGIATLYSEDFQHGRDVEGVRFVNPFAGPAAATPIAPADPVL